MYCVQPDKGYYGSSNDPVWVFEVWIPFINSSLEPAERLPAAQEGSRLILAAFGLCPSPAS